jgi:hypothetical protein
MRAAMAHSDDAAITRVILAIERFVIALDNSGCVWI